jgi:hypothetical protein
MATNMKFDLHGADPDHPVAATRHICRVTVAWGYVRYATRGQYDKLYFWDRQMGDWIGIPPLAAVFLWLLYKPEKQNQR